MADIHLTLVKEIEKHPVLYNYSLPEYFRKDMSEKAWNEVASKTQLTVNECKEKWRNIRSSLTRNLKPEPKLNRPKKPYYLTQYLAFVLPFMKIVKEKSKSGNNPIQIEVNPVHSEAKEEEWNSRSNPVKNEASSLESEDEEEQSVYVEERIIDANDNSQFSSQSEDSIQEPVRSTISFQSPRKRSNEIEVDTVMSKLLKKNLEREPKPDQISNNQSKMNFFFLSLLTEFDDMTEQQMRTFKIKVLNLIDEIKRDPL